MKQPTFFDVMTTRVIIFHIKFGARTLHDKQNKEVEKK